jgi:hypothetical protein
MFLETLFLLCITIQVTKGSLISLLNENVLDKKSISPNQILEITNNFISFAYEPKDLVLNDSNDLERFYKSALNRLNKDERKKYLKDELVSLEQFKKDSIGAFRMCIISDASLSGDLRKQVQEKWNQAVSLRELFRLKCFSKCLFLYELTLARGYASQTPENSNISTIYEDMVDILEKSSPYEKEKKEKLHQRKIQEEQRIQEGSILVPIFGLTFIFIITMGSILLGMKALQNSLEKENKSI